MANRRSQPPNSRRPPECGEPLAEATFQAFGEKLEENISIILAATSAEYRTEFQLVAHKRRIL